MTMTSALILGVLAGGSLALLSGWVLRDRAFRRTRCSLASGLIGEMAAVLRAVEVHEVAGELARIADEKDDGKLELSGFALPPFVIYQASAGRLAMFRSPLPRQIAYFYTRLGALTEDLRALSAPPPGASDARSRHARTTLEEMRETLDLAGDILRELRVFVSRHHPASILRA